MSELKGRRTILVARCSTDGQIEASIPKQLEMGDQFVLRHGMIKVDEVKLEGKSASLREHVPHLLALIQRKLSTNDFDTLHFMSLNRFDRSRADGEELFRRMERAGILVTTEKEGTFDGKYGWIKRGLILQEAQGYVEDLAFHSRTGTARAIKEGIIPPSPFIYGLDRLYLDSQEVPQFILRKVSKNVLERRHPETKELLGTMIRSVAEKRKSLRIIGGKVVLIPGDPVRIEVVRRIFHRRYVLRWSAMRIARSLNEEQVQAPHGGLWLQGTVLNIVLNSSFTGTGRANVTISGKYVGYGKDGIVVYETPREVIPHAYNNKKMCKRVPVLHQPMDNWEIIPLPELEGFLPEPLRELAIAGQNAYLKAREDRRQLNSVGRESGGNRGHGSYPLSGILCGLQTGIPMTGQNSGRWRSYKTSRARHLAVSEGSLFRRCVSAGPVEVAVLKAVTEVINTNTGLKSVIRQQVVEAFDATQEARGRLDEFTGEKSALEQEYACITRDLGVRGRELTKARAEWIERRLDSIDANISMIMSHQIVTPEQVEATATAVTNRLKNLGAAVAAGEIKGIDLQDFYRTIIRRLEVDLVTNEVYMDLGLPASLLRKTAENPILVDSSQSASVYQNSHEKPLILAAFHCTRVKTGRTHCLDCTRRPSPNTLAA